MPRELAIEARAPNLEGKIAARVGGEHAQHAVVVGAARNAVGDEAPVGRGRIPVERGAFALRHARRIEQHALGAREAVAHAQHRRRLRGTELEVEDAPGRETDVAHIGRGFAKRAQALGERGPPGDRVERRACLLALHAHERLRARLRQVLERAQRIGLLGGGHGRAEGERRGRDAIEDARHHAAVATNCSAASRA